LAALFLPASPPDFVEAAVFFGIAAFVAHGLAYRLPRGGFGDIAFIPLLSGVAVAPGFAIVLATAVALLVGEYFRHRETIRIVFNSAQLTLAVGLAVLIYDSLGGLPLTAAGAPSVIPFVAAFAIFFLSNAVSFAGVVSVSSSERFGAVLVRAAGGTSLIYDLIGIPIVFGFAYAYVRVGWGWSGALLLPLVGLRQVYKTNRELQTVNEELLQLMVAAIEARDRYTSGHSQRVATYSRIVARAAGLGPRTAERIYTAALLHDVGKIHEEFAPILRKPGRLSDDEFAIMKTHTTKGAALVGRVTQFEDLVPAVQGHHEAWDGSGYPNELQGDQIPLWARVIAVADTIDAMTTDRPYREALTLESVRDELSRQGGRQFDPHLITAVVADKMWAAIQTALGDPSMSRLPAKEVSAVPRHSSAHRRVVGV
jgi:putative nucleotidyltransferase with HDIG domain